MSKDFNELVKIFEKLHSKNGCMWDKKQTHRTLLKYLREETGEFIEAVKEKDSQGMKEELGDILLQVMFHSQIAKKQKKFTIVDVIKTLNEKLKRRHPHVFSNKKVKSVNEIIANWKEIKRKEKTAPNSVKQYKRQRASAINFPDQSRKSSHGQGHIQEKYWFAPNGNIFPVEREHGDQALKIARELELIPPHKAISDFGFKSNWELARGLLLDKGWLRVQVYNAKTIGFNAKPNAIENKFTRKATFTVLSHPRGFFFQENWPYTLEYRTSIDDYKRYGWKIMIKLARAAALQRQNAEKAILLKYQTT